MSLIGPQNILPSLIAHGLFNGDIRHPRATKFVSKWNGLPKPVFSEATLEEGRALPRPERKKYFAKLKEEYYKAS